MRFKKHKITTISKKCKKNKMKQLETVGDTVGCQFSRQNYVILDSKSLISKSTTLKITLFLPRDFTSSLASNCFQLLHLVFLCFLHSLLNGVIFCFWVQNCLESAIWIVHHFLRVISTGSQVRLYKNPLLFCLTTFGVIVFFFLIVLQYID